MLDMQAILQMHKGATPSPKDNSLNISEKAKLFGG
jgi:hypothetical protein